MKLEVVVVPVSDVDRTKEFYKALGWREDADFPITEDYRIVQLTPPGSAASIIFGQGVTSAAPGSMRELMLVVSDLDEARRELLGYGVDVSDVFHDETGAFHHADGAARVIGRNPAVSDYGSFASFDDPDGNGWILQEVKVRAPGR
jgi:catechol 2,3-dioxygenase-like lactoylglutathione lyase family enzyme